jgi:ATP-dependent Lon protease
MRTNFQRGIVGVILTLALGQWAHAEVTDMTDFVKAKSGLLVPDRCKAGLSKLSTLKIYSNDDVNEAIIRNDGIANKRLHDFYALMQKKGGTRTLFSAPEASTFDKLGQASPNFEEVIFNLKTYANLYRSADEHMQFTPMLLLGPPGVGKTHFAQTLSEVIGTPFQRVSMDGVSAGFVITGNSPQWQDAQPGRVSRALVEGSSANPIILLDEIDKAGGDKRYDPMAALHTLLEPDTAQSFKDEFVDIEMDARHVLWIVTANNVEMIPDSIKSRMAIYEIPQPNKEQMILIAQNIYSDVLKEHPRWKFDSTLPGGVLEKLVNHSPREMKQAITDAFPFAFASGRTVFSPDDIKFKKLKEKNRIGF